jgi:hypothetical protein
MESVSSTIDSKNNRMLVLGNRIEHLEKKSKVIHVIMILIMSTAHMEFKKQAVTAQFVMSASYAFWQLGENEFFLGYRHVLNIVSTSIVVRLLNGIVCTAVFVVVRGLYILS